MECRIFNAASIFAVFVGLINASINFAINLDVYGYIMFLLVASTLYGYYLSRFRGRLSVAVGIFAVSFNLQCGLTYFVADGSNGVNLFAFTIFIFILCIVSSYRQLKIWIPFTFIVLIVLFVLEYHYPEMVKTIYVSKKHRLLDLVQTFFEAVLLIIAITIFVKKNYNREKELAKFRLISLENSNETKNKLFSIVSHDLKAPLSSIENYLTLLGQLDLSTAEKTEIEKQLLSSTKQTSDMLQNILSWSKDQMEGITVNLKPIYIKKSLFHTIALQRSIAAEKGIELCFSADQDFEVIADTDMLQLIVRNLLNNAIKFSLPGGAIHVDVFRREDKCILSVKDDGIGIADEQIPLMFSLKINGTYGTNKEKGVGLGLKLTKTYAELQNGKIWFESEIDRGSTFYVSLDLHKR